MAHSQRAGDRNAEFNLSGIGQGWVVWRGEILPSVQVTNVTPIDETDSDYWFCMTTARADGDSDGPTGVDRKMIDHQMKTIEQDFFTWENMKILHTPNFAPEEAKNYARAAPLGVAVLPAAARADDRSGGRRPPRVHGPGSSRPLRRDTRQGLRQLRRQAVTFADARGRVTSSPTSWSPSV